MKPTPSLHKYYCYFFLIVLLFTSRNSFAQQFTFANGWGQSNATSADRGRAVCTDASGNVYITGKFYLNSIDLGGGALTSAGNEDCFVAKFNSSGVHQWSIRMGGTSFTDEARGIATDGSYVYVTGIVNGAMTVGTSPTSYPATTSGLIDGFVMKLDASNAAVSWVTRFGGNNTDEGQAVCLDGSGNVYISGIFRTRDVNPTATFGGFTRTVQGNTTSYTSDLFVAKLNSSGVFQWVSTGGNSGGNDNINGSGICYVPSLGEVVVVGNNRSNGSITTTYSTSSPASNVSLNNSNATLNEDFILLEVSASDGTFLSGSNVGAGDANEAALGVTYDANTGDVFFCGYFFSASVTFPGNSAITNGSGGVKANGFYGRYNPSTNAYTWVKEIVNSNDASAADDNVRGIASNGVGGIYLVGNFAGTTTFPDGGVGIGVTSASSSDIFLTKVNASDGNAQWVRQGSGNAASGDIGYGVAYASSGASVWITGSYVTTMTFSPMSGLSSAGNTDDIFLAKLADQPQVSSVSVPANGTYKVGDNLNFTVNWNTAVTVTGSPYIGLTIGASAKNASYLSGSGTTALVFRYTVAASDFDNNGIAVGSSITLNGGTIKNTAATAVDALLALNSIGNTTSVLVDGVVPSVNSINRQTPATANTNATTLVYRVTFSEIVSNVDIADFSTTATGSASGSIASVSSSSGTTIDVTLNSVSGDGTLRLDLKASGTGIIDAAGNAISGGYTSGQTYTLDHTAPSVNSINRQTPATANTNATSLVYRVTFSESVSNVDISDFSLTATGSVAGSVASVSASSGTTIDVTVNSVSGDGTLRLDLKASGTGIVDAFSNAISGGYTSGQTYTLDHTAPSVSSINRQTPSSASTNATSVVYRITFSEIVSNVDITDFLVVSTGSATGSLASVSASSGTAIDVTLNSVSGNGTLRLDLKGSGTGIVDAFNNAISGGFSSGQTYTIDNAAPSVNSINRLTPATATTNSSTLIWRVIFSENVSNVDVTDFSLTSTGASTGTISSVSAAAGTTIDLTINSASGSGTLRLDLKGSGTGITDDGGNAISGGYTSGQAYTLATPGLWTGNTSTDYSLAANWDDNTVPTGSTNITIPTGAVRMPVLTASSAANNISLQNATTLSLSGQSFTVNGNITVAGTGKLVGSSSSVLSLLGTGSSNITFDQTNDGTTNALGTLIINGSGSTNTLGGKLNIYTLLTLTTGNLSLNDNTVVLKSTSIAATAMVSTIGGTISYGSAGKFTAERYIPLGKRSYRLLAPGVSGSSNSIAISTIYQNWQNGGTYSAGIGTHITGNGTNGTDITSTGQNSMFTYTPGALNYSPVTSTSQANDTLSAISGYRLFIRGDRTAANLTQANNSGTGTPNINMNSATKLSATGRLLSGTIVFDETKTTISGTDGWKWQKNNAPLTTNTGADDSYSLIPNPYLAMVDWNSVTINDLSTTYYIWDPNKNLRGGYQSYNRTGGVASSATISRYIQPGQAFFVQTTGADPSLTIMENHKNTTSSNLLVAFKTATVMPRLDVSLSYKSRPGEEADNCIAVFDNSFSAGISAEDSYKLENPDDNISIIRNNVQLVVEGRPLITANDTIFLRLSGLQTDTLYDLTITAADFNLPPGYTGYLEDIYTASVIPLNMSGAITMEFAKLSDSTSFYHRFRIVFRSAGPLPLDITSVKAYEKGSGNQVEWTNSSESNLREYVVERSINGISFNKAATVNARSNNNNTVQYKWFDASPADGISYYRITAVGINGAVKHSSIVRVNRHRKEAGMMIFPNPVSGEEITLQLNDLEKGSYQLRMMNMIGSTVMQQELTHTGGSASYVFQLNKIPKGTYYIQLINHKIKLEQKVVLQ